MPLERIPLHGRILANLLRDQGKSLADLTAALERRVPGANRQGTVAQLLNAAMNGGVGWFHPQLFDLVAQALDVDPSRLRADLHWQHVEEMIVEGQEEAEDDAEEPPEWE